MNKYELEPIESNIFNTIEKNILNRNKKIVQLANLLDNVNENIIVSIDGKWGSGKTFFVKQFRYLINNLDRFTNNKILSEKDKTVFKSISDNNRVIYYNAWENDDHEIPIESLIYSILNECKEQKDMGVSFEDIKDCLKGFVKDFIYASSKGIIDIENFDKLKTFGDLSKEIRTVEEKKIAFYELLKKITGQKRIILIIDELDRCNPVYAVKLLETIKHFYNYDRISIIVSTDNMKLSHTIRKFYGYDFDGYEYLNKMYDLVISLETHELKKYIQQTFGLCTKTWFSEDVSYELMRYYKFSLRECNRYATFYRILSNYINRKDIFNKEESTVIYGLLIPIAIALKIKDIKKYEAFINNDEGIVLKGILDNVFGNNEYYVQWLSNIVKDESGDNYKNIIINLYKKSFTDSDYKEDEIPIIMQVTSLLCGNMNLIEKNNY